jgi:hypothetical protein
VPTSWVPRRLRQFLLDHIDRVVYANDRVALCGSIPVDLRSSVKPGELGVVSSIGFRIEDALPRERRRGQHAAIVASRARAANELRQWVLIS